MLYQLIYASVRLTECSDLEIKKILDSANRNNGKYNITGVLLYSQSKFLQVLEGSKDEILGLYDKIKEDKRHKNVIMISLKPIDQRYFPSWQMGSKQVNTDTYDFLSYMSSSEQQEFKALFKGEQSNNAIAVINKLFK